jgi:hypothetical protein
MTKINYNGWANRDTWLTNLNIMNTSEIYTAVLDVIQKKMCLARNRARE